MLEDGGPLPGPCERNRHDLTQPRLRTVRHQQQPVRQIKRLVHIVRHHDDCISGTLPDFEQRVLQVEAGQRIQHAERLVQQ